MGSAYRSAKGRVAWVLMLGVLAALGAIFVWRGATRAEKMQPEPSSKSQFVQLTAQGTAKIVIEILTVGQQEIRGRLLEKQDETHYLRTDNPVEIKRSAATVVVMGEAADIRPGAILHVTGALGTDHSVEARKIVILTGYLQVK